MEYEKAIYHEKILKCLFEFSDILNLNVKTKEENGVVKHIFKRKNRTLFIVRIKGNTISVSVVLWLLDLYYSNKNNFSSDVSNAIEQTKKTELVYDMFDKYCISYSFKFNEPSMKVVNDLKNLLQEEVYQIEKLVA
ncbi:MAG: hypothetical protein R3Y24_06750 [Eubacteriales bacterium]